LYFLENNCYFFIYNIENRYKYNGHIVYSYRLGQAMKGNMLQNASLKNEIMIHEEIISAIHIHRKAMELVFIRIFIVYIMLTMLIRKTANILLSYYRSQKKLK